jgi:CheY-like chemotaxis protein
MLDLNMPGMDGIAVLERLKTLAAVIRRRMITYTPV